MLKQFGLTTVYISLAILAILIYLVSELTWDPDQGTNLAGVYLLFLGLPWSLLVPDGLGRWVAFVFFVGCLLLNTVIVAALETGIRRLISQR